MGLFIDSSDPREIKELFAWGVLSGATTRPLIIAELNDARHERPAPSKKR